MSQQNKPSLPSIQFLLDETPEYEVKKEALFIIKPTPINKSSSSAKNHNKSNSISSLPTELQQLSLSAPAYKQDSIIPERSENDQPSWMMMPPSTITTVTTSITRPPGACHNRSNSSLSFPIIKSRHQTHRRSASANMTGSIEYNHHNQNLPLINEQQRARTDSPPTTNNTNSETELNNALNIKKKYDYENLMVARDEQTGRYYCPFCNKPFNRPSSLRIHTYSHTGEKPFVCQEEGCGRQFSVQSNMRRHLRVHRLGRSKSNNNNTKTTNSFCLK
ncbi:hypothetical protein BD770DRAFT_400061 [Pilaira anomala]|nr:hypothetical protein BD770DRAFT_400061 [Pilaira anomala]